MSITQFQYDEMKRRCEGGKGSQSLPDGSGRAGDSKESVLHDKITQYCRDRGWIYFHGSMAHRAMRTVGEPDFQILADGGRVFFVECKTVKGKLSAQQLGLKMWAEKLGHAIHTVRTFEEFVEIVTGQKTTQPPRSTT